MKKSELRAIIKEEIQRLTELSKGTLEAYIKLAKEKGHNDLAKKLEIHKLKQSDAKVIVTDDEVPYIIAGVSKTISRRGPIGVTKFPVLKLDLLGVQKGTEWNAYVVFDTKGNFYELVSTLHGGAGDYSYELIDRESANIIANICKKNGFHVEPRQLMDYKK